MYLLPTLSTDTFMFLMCWAIVSSSIVIDEVLNRVLIELRSCECFNNENVKKKRFRKQIHAVFLFFQAQLLELVLKNRKYVAPGFKFTSLIS